MLLRFLVACSILVAQAPPAADAPVIRANTRIVNVNVLAFDKKGNPVRDLTRDDFTVMDGGAPRPISLFAVETADSSTTPPPAALPPGTFTNRVNEKASSATIFLFDGLNTRAEDQASSRADLLKYLKTLEPTDRVALFSLGRELLMLHDFTSDTAALTNAIARRPVRLNQEVASSTPTIANTGDPILNGMLNNSNQGIADFTDALRAANTVAALEAIAAHAARLPGRKNLVWISGGFPMAIGFGRRNATNTQSFSLEVDRATKALSDAGIAVYPVDARRLEAQSLSDVTGNIARPLSTRGQTQAIAAAKDDPNFQPMEELASGTGGRAYHNLNDLGDAIRTATADARMSYALAFTPAEGPLDGKYHPIKIEVKRPGIQLRYRAGYIAFPDQQRMSLFQAMMSPTDFTGVGITVGLKPVPGAVNATFSIDARNLTLEKKGDDYEVTLELILITGKLRTAPKSAPATFKIAAASLDRVMKEGLLIGIQLKTPTTPVAYHIGVRDIASGAIGTLHLAKN